jgi:hypothetical protein
VESARPARVAAASSETTFGYWERKNDEVALLREQLGIDGPAIVTIPDLVRDKQYLRAQMIARFIAGHPHLTESNLGNPGMDVDGASLGFHYQRYDMRLRRKPFAPWIYPALASRHLSSLGFLCTSGMSAVTAALTALDLLHGETRPIYLAPDTYFETRQFVRDYLYQLKSVFELPAVLVRCGALVLDSICHVDPLARLGACALDALCAVVFDTTCYDVSAPEIERVVERCRAAGVPCVLVRSHLKIDTLGLEYGRLGSIVIVLPRPCPPARARFVRHLRRRIADFLVKTGTGFSIASYFPLTSDPAFRRLNQRRNAVMRDNNLRCAAALSEIVHPRSAARVVAYHHGRFLFLHTPVGDRSGRQVGALAHALLEAGICARPAPSFGYDFTAITRLAGPSFPDGDNLRISLPDFSAEELELCIDTIARFAIDRFPAQLAQPTSSST